MRRRHISELWHAFKDANQLPPGNHELAKAMFYCGAVRGLQFFAETIQDAGDNAEAYARAQKIIKDLEQEVRDWDAAARRGNAYKSI